MAVKILIISCDLSVSILFEFTAILLFEKMYSSNCLFPMRTF
jgi:hypothetical protein